jgi:hypothetical protein
MRRIRVVVSSLTLIACVVLSPALPSFPAESETSALVRAGRWLQYNGQYRYFVGFDNQELVADTSIDYTAVLDTLRDVRVNKIRIWFDAYRHPTYLHPWVRRNGKYDLDHRGHSLPRLPRRSELAGQLHVSDCLERGEQHQRSVQVEFAGTFLPAILRRRSPGGLCDRKTMKDYSTGHHRQSPP